MYEISKKNLALSSFFTMLRNQWKPPCFMSNQSDVTSTLWQRQKNQIFNIKKKIPVKTKQFTTSKALLQKQRPTPLRWLTERLTTSFLLIKEKLEKTSSLLKKSKKKKTPNRFSLFVTFPRSHFASHYKPELRFFTTSSLVTQCHGGDTCLSLAPLYSLALQRQLSSSNTGRQMSSSGHRVETDKETAEGQTRRQRRDKYRLIKRKLHLRGRQRNTHSYTFETSWKSKYPIEHKSISQLFVNMLLKNGKKSKAEKIFYKSLILLKNKQMLFSERYPVKATVISSFFSSNIDLTLQTQPRFLPLSKEYDPTSYLRNVLKCRFIKTIIQPQFTSNRMPANPLIKIGDSLNLSTCFVGRGFISLRRFLPSKGGKKRRLSYAVGRREGTFPFIKASQHFPILWEKRLKKMAYIRLNKKNNPINIFFTLKRKVFRTSLKGETLGLTLQDLFKERMSFSNKSARCTSLSKLYQNRKSLRIPFITIKSTRLDSYQ